jgi:RHS repeat-associated protein
MEISMRICRIAALFSLIVLVQLAVAQEVPTQVTDQNRTGDLPFSSSIGTGIEHVDLLTGGLHINLPIENIPNRFDYHLSYHWDSNYFLLAMRLDGLGRPFWIWTTEVNSGWQTNTGFLTDSTPFRIQCTDYPSEGWFYGYSNYLYWDHTGAKHSLAVQEENGNCTGFTGDSSGPVLTGKGMWATATGYLANVLLANGGVEDTQDSNGNLAGGSMGRTMCTSTNTADGHGNLTQTVYTCIDSNGNPQSYTVNWQLITINTNFNYGGFTELTGLAVNVVSSIVLPNGRQYVFKYNDPYGEITEIDLPTGGAITYTWTNVHASPDIFRLGRRVVASRTEWPNGVTNGGVCQSGSSSCSTWQLSFALVGRWYTTTVTYPAAGNPLVQNQSVFEGEDGAITDAQIYAGSATGTPIREYQMGYGVDTDPTTDDACWNPGGLLLPPQVPQPVGQRLTSITTILEDGLTQAQKQFDYETFTYTYYPNHCTDLRENSIAKQYTTSRGNVTEIREYDWGSGAHGALIRRTDKTYLHSPGNPNYLTYLALNIVNKVVQSTVYDSMSTTCQGNGQPCAQTQYEYDNYVPNVNALINTSATPDPAHDYTNHPSTFVYRGNVTRVQRWPNTTGNPLTTIYTYDDLGNIRAIQDPVGNTTSYSYLNSWSGSSCPVHSGYNDQQFLTQITDALGHQVKRTYYQCSSLLAAHQDQNDITAGRTGTLYSYDWAGRVTQTQDTHLPSDSSWGSTSNTYNDVPPITASTSTAITASLNKTSIATKDGLGRVIETQLSSDPDGTTEVDTAYDALGRTTTVSNPHRGTSSSTDGTTTTNYDILSRVLSVNEPDGSSVSTTYSANCTTSTDEAGKKRKSCSDGLGRMTTVWEDPSTLNYETDYSYDALNNLKSVTQKGSNPANARIRTFNYDAMSRLTSAINPESGTITYSYPTPGGTMCAGDASAVCSKIAPLPNQTGSATVTANYTYDALNRLTGKNYVGMGTLGSKYAYDGNSPSGCTPSPPSLTDSNPIYQRTSMCDGSGATSWTHDQMARVAIEKRTIRGLTNQSKQLSYAYNLDGSLWKLTYPGTGKVIMYTVGGAGRPTSALDVGGNIKYVTSATYAPFGGLTGMVNGAATGFSGINIADTYNDRLQAVQLYVTTATITSATLTQLQSMPCPTVAATIMSRSYNFSVGSNDNGNVQSITNCLDTTRTQSFTYDSLNRISTGQSSGTGSTSWGEQYTIDAWSNLTNISPVTGKANHEGLSCASASTKNQLNTCYGYDAAGNLTQNGSVNYVYDAENRLAWSNTGYDYVYDGDGSRVVKCTSSAQSNSCPTGSTGTLYWRPGGGDTISETNLAGTNLEEYIFFNGRRVARRDVSTNTVHYYFSDHLGSASAVTNATGSSLDENLDYYPFGGLAPTSTDSVPQNYKFTGKERDAESGLDNFGARYYGSNLSRFVSPDPVQIKANRLLNPQRLNLYGYAVNNPLVNIDPDGRDAIAVVFPDYKIQTPIGKLPGIGHAGVVTIDSKGHARYLEYGRYDDANKGIVREKTVPSVTMKDGKPTQDSLNNLLKSVSDQAGHGGKIEGAYFTSDDKQTQKMNDYAEGRLSQNNDPNRTPYSLDDNHCGTFMDKTIEAGGINLPGTGDQWPNHQIGPLQSDAGNKVEYDPAKKTTRADTSAGDNKPGVPNANQNDDK